MLKPIEIAKNEVGYKEEKNNITKYSKFFDSEVTNYFNTKKQGAAWCSIFVNFLFVKAYGAEKAKQMLYEPQNGNCAAGCKYAAAYFKTKAAFYSTPQIGDQIFFGAPGNEQHTGIVVKADRDYVWTIEGNKNNMVCECRYSLNDKNISGYGRPNWSLANDTQPVITEDKCMIELPVLKLGSKGDAVKSLQILLNGYNFVGKNGRKLTVDGDFGANTDYALRAFQKSAGLTPDGVCGVKTWPALIK